MPWRRVPQWHVADTTTPLLAGEGSRNIRQQRHIRDTRVATRHHIARSAESPSSWGERRAPTDAQTNRRSAHSLVCMSTRACAQAQAHASMHMHLCAHMCACCRTRAQ
eukprot:14938153-Alexandrium_andersonii.AAC.1